MSPAYLSASEPLQPLLAFHRRTEKHLAQLAALAGDLEGHGLAPETCAAASVILRGLGDASAEHHAIEESRLLPAIERRIREAGPLAEFREMRRLIAHEHGRIAQAWRPLRRPLEAIAEGVPRALDACAIVAFRALYARHIVAEEAALHRFALRCPPGAHAVIARQRATA